MSDLGLIFGFSLVVALTGALVPGPLFTYTIVKTLDTPKRGFLVGAWVIAGHAILESAMIAAILLGFSAFLKNALVIKLIGALGGGFLLYMGFSIAVGVARKRIRLDLGARAETDPVGPASSPPSRGCDGGPRRPGAPRRGGRSKLISNPVLGGVLVSMSNPYWWIWWATVGFGFMLQYRISLANWPALLSFVSGHEMGDLAWYFAVSTLVSLGRRRINEKIYGWVLAVCSAVIVCFGVWLGLSAFLR